MRTVEIDAQLQKARVDSRLQMSSRVFAMVFDVIDKEQPVLQAKVFKAVGFEKHQRISFYRLIDSLVRHELVYKTAGTYLWTTKPEEFHQAPLPPSNGTSDEVSDERDVRYSRELLVEAHYQMKYVTPDRLEYFMHCRTLAHSVCNPSLSTEDRRQLQDTIFTMFKMHGTTKNWELLCSLYLLIAATNNTSMLKVLDESCHQRFKELLSVADLSFIEKFNS